MSHDANYLKRGAGNYICARCGRKVKNIRPEWTGIKVCDKCWDPRHPWTLPLPIAIDSLPLPNAQPRPTPQFIQNMNTDLSIWSVQYQLGTTLVPNIQWNAWTHIWGGDIGLPFTYSNFPQG